jgi:hypothetical protein
MITSIVHTIHRDDELWSGHNYNPKSVIFSFSDPVLYGSSFLLSNRYFTKGIESIISQQCVSIKRSFYPYFEVSIDYLN